MFLSQHQKDSNFELEIMLLLWRNVKSTRPWDKLDYQRLGPYVNIDQINDIAFCLDLPPYMLLHPMFHISLLEPYALNSILVSLLKA